MRFSSDGLVGLVAGTVIKRRGRRGLLSFRQQRPALLVARAVGEEEAVAALAHLEERRNKGDVVVRIQQTTDTKYNAAACWAVSVCPIPYSVPLPPFSISAENGTSRRNSKIFFSS